MTADEYAALVMRTVRATKAARGLYEDEHALAMAYDALAAESAARCLGVGRALYEVDERTQRFERHDAADAVAMCREEALDVPAYLAQVAWHMGTDADPDIRDGIHHAAQLLVILERLKERVA